MLRKLHRTKLLFILSGFYLLAPAIHAEDYFNQQNNKQSFYKWKDEKGVTHYSATPPTKNPKGIVKKVKTNIPIHDSPDLIKSPLKPTTPSAQPTAPPFAPLDSNKRPDLNAERDTACEKTKQTLDTLKTKPRLYEKTDKEERHYLTEPEIKDRTKQAEQFLQENC